MKHWILDDKGRPVAVDLLTWAKWFGTAERVVCQETIAQNWLSTIFLGIDHNFDEHGPPILWETMTFGAKLNSQTRRCAGSKEQAEAMHEEMVKAVCKASGIDYDVNRERVKNAGVYRRLAAVQRKKIRAIMCKMEAFSAIVHRPGRKRAKRKPGPGKNSGLLRDSTKRKPNGPGARK